MKKISILFATVFFLNGAVQAQVKDRDQMVKKIFTILKTADKEGFIRLFPNAEVTKSFLRKTMMKDSALAGMQDMLNAYFDKISDDVLQKEYAEDFKRAMEYASKAGADLSKAVLVSYTADSVKDDQEEQMPVSKLSGNIYFTIDTANYFIKFNNVIWFEDEGWYGVNIRRIDKKSREFESDDDIAPPEEVIKDVAIDTVATPPPPQKPKVAPKTSPAKPGTKPTNAKTTSKTVTPAKKPD